MIAKISPYRLPVQVEPPRVYSSCRRCEWSILEQHRDDRCEIFGGRECATVNPEGECNRWSPRRSWWRRLFGIGAP